ncbi:hypothetical protein AB0D49_01590 [Streptomyces sp. NPDC048290]|uniref:hypothetical protein n=1 Tax=Streptomyces sp. NPDC048290 TaxID=3155811 RepID=UPI00341F3559
MDLTLLPEVGVATIRLGMAADEAIEAARQLGFTAPNPDHGATPGQVFCEHPASDSDITLGFTKGALTDIHVSRFRKEDADVHVVLDGLDIFRTPSDELLETLQEHGHRVEQNDDGVDVLPDLKVILSNESSFDYPTDDEGDPLYFDYALVTSVFLHGPRGD